MLVLGNSDGYQDWKTIIDFFIEQYGESGNQPGDTSHAIC